MKRLQDLVRKPLRWLDSTAPVVNTDPSASARLAALAASEARFKRLTLLGSDWCWDLDASLSFTAVSGNLADPIGSTIAQHLGRPLWEMPHISTLRGGWSTLRNSLLARRTFRDMVLRAPRREGGYSYVSYGTSRAGSSIRRAPRDVAGGTSCGTPCGWR